MGARSLAAFAFLALLLNADAGHAGWAACDSAARKASPDDQIRLYTLCITNRQIRAWDIAYALSHRAYAYIRKDELDHALDDVNLSLRYNPNDQYPYELRAYIYARRMQWDLADQELTTIVEHTAQRHQADALMSRGLLRFCLGNCADALHDFDQALTLYPKQPFAYGLKSRVLSTCADERARNGAEALILARRALTLRDDVFSHSTLATALAEAGEFTDSLRELGIAETMARTDGPSKRDLRQLAEARALFENAQPYRQRSAEPGCFVEPRESDGEKTE